MKPTLINGTFYDLSDFEKKHPGGNYLLSMAIGRDATIMFESHHIRNNIAESVLKTLPIINISKKEMAEIFSFESIAEIKDEPTPNNSAIYLSIRNRVQEEILFNRSNKYRQGSNFWSTCIISLTWLASYFTYMKFPSIITGCLFGSSMAWVGLGIQHTANHGALFRSPKLNEIFGYMNDLCGGSSLIWRYHHQVSHHSYTNHPLLDQDISGTMPFLRLHNTQPHMVQHMFQFLYEWMLMPLLYWSVNKTDIISVLSNKIDLVSLQHIRTLDIPLFWVGKILHFNLVLIVPLWYKFYYRGIVFSFDEFSTNIYAYITAVSCGSLILSCLFLVSHLFVHPDQMVYAKQLNIISYKNKFEKNQHNEQILASSSCQEITSEKNVIKQQKRDWAREQILASSSWGGYAGCFVTGGLNLQIEHHLFPGISHTLYPKIQYIVKEECIKYKIPYFGYSTLFQNILAHVKFMWKMGQTKYQSDRDQGKIM